MIRRPVKRLIQRLGFDLVRLRQSNSGIIKSDLSNLGIETVFDVGANVGQYGLSLRLKGYSGHIISFEPLTSAHSELVDCAKHDEKWTVHSRIAIGAAAGTTTINISENSYSSSLLPMLEKHKSSAPKSQYIASEKVEVQTLKSLLHQYCNSPRNYYLKIDTQGFEKNVLDGLGADIELFAGVQVELSVVPLYEGAEHFSYFFDFFSHHGFILWDVQRGFSDPKSNQMLQFDAVFVKL